RSESGDKPNADFPGPPESITRPRNRDSLPGIEGPVRADGSLVNESMHSTPAPRIRPVPDARWHRDVEFLTESGMPRQGVSMRRRAGKECRDEHTIFLPETLGRWHRSPALARWR